MKYLQVVDGVIISAFAGPQDPERFPGLVEVEDDDPRYLGLIASVTPEKLVLEPSALERQWRDAQLLELVWLRDRHRDQLEIGATTTLTAEQFAELLVFMQALRDWPQSEAFPDESARPVPPVFLEQLGGDQ
ncbi:phage tail assembly chaperone [Pseudomonas sp. RIT623]|uniref:phage tail assembly chaperone n=1 Tax=Pseudomonas sp. RIT623 TaxID=2559075 RepID=UPI00106FFB22|nr:phage tail assembly chaperone [Pseudomonas sp. RIT623]TFF42855.1 hypothetical protein E3U47_02840 [Pseudomonas sp. RIT623]